MIQNFRGGGGGGDNFCFCWVAGLYNTTYAIPRAYNIPSDTTEHKVSTLVQGEGHGPPSSLPPSEEAQNSDEDKDRLSKVTHTYQSERKAEPAGLSDMGATLTLETEQCTM